MKDQIIAFIGLGNMGYPMAGHLANAGFTLRVYNRSSEKALQWLNEYSGTSHPTPAETANNADAVIICVGADKDLLEVANGPQGFLRATKTGALVIDHTTTSASAALELAELCHQQDIQFIDAPVSGGQQGAINGQLTIMAGGTNDAIERSKPLVNPYSKGFEHMGPVGAGQQTKMVNQICVAGLLQGLAEGMHFGIQAGLDMNKVMSLLAGGAAGSWQMSNRYQTMLNDQYQHGFAVDWMHKDLDICLKEADKMGLKLPITQQIDEYYQQIQAQGGGRWDTSSLLKRLQTQKESQ
jgi:3-hydroxyisobutyrate dehydrogenase-like beta-hydroxyacid dehydrogenase